MKFMRGIDGVIQAYTDEGVYAGDVTTMGDRRKNTTKAFQGGEPETKQITPKKVDTEGNVVYNGELP